MSSNTLKLSKNLNLFRTDVLEFVGSPINDNYHDNKTFHIGKLFRAAYSSWKKSKGAQRVKESRLVKWVERAFVAIFHVARILLETRPPLENPILLVAPSGFAFKCQHKMHAIFSMRECFIACVCATGKDRGRSEAWKKGEFL